METVMKISNDAVAVKIEDALRLRVGHGKRTSFASLAEVTGIKERTLRSYEEGATPTVAGLLSIGAALGPGFMSDVLGIIGQSAKNGTTDEPQHMPTLCAATAFSSLLAEALEDGHVDHREGAAMQPLARALIKLLDPIANGTTVVPVRGVVK